jgi:hypothetical protein
VLPTQHRKRLLCPYSCLPPSPPMPLAGRGNLAALFRV